MTQESSAFDDEFDSDIGNTPTGTRLRLLDNGWHPIAVTGKRPNVGLGWERYCQNPPTNLEIDRWGKSAADSTGIALGPCAVAIDIDIKSSPELAQAARDLAFEHFGRTPFVRVGQSPKLLLVYRPGPDGVETRHFKDATGTGDGLDILSDGSQFVAYGTHPDTKRPYTWVGDSNPLDEGPEAAPEITQDQVDAYLAAFSREIMPLQAAGGRAGGNGQGGGEVVRNGDGLVIDGGYHWFNLEVTLRAARELGSEGVPLTGKAIFERAWAAWTDLQTGAVWRDEKATQYVWKEAQYTAERVASGRLNVEPQESYEMPADPTYRSCGVDVEQAREATDAAIDNFIEGIPIDGSREQVSA